MGFRNAQWVTFGAAVEGAHVTPDGRTVGIYHARDLPANGHESGPSVTPVCPEGKNLVKIEHDAQGEPHLVAIRLHPADLADLEPLVEHDHVPAARQNPTYPPGHQLRR